MGVAALASVALAAAGANVVSATTVATWRPVAVPQPASRTSHELLGVSCPKPTFCMAVGTSLDVSDTEAAPAVETFNGRTWSRRHAPTIGHTTFLAAVSCPSATSCTVVGTSQTGTDSVPVAEHWNGRTWRVESTVNPAGGGDFESVSCPTTTTCMATGLRQTTIGGQPASAALAERWRSGGRGWTITAVPAPAAGSLLAAVSCPTASHCVAVGSDSISAAPIRELVEIWNGRRWTTAKVPKPAGDSGLSGVACRSAVSCVATGTTAKPNLGQTATSLIYSHSTWSVHSVPKPPGSSKSNELSGLTCRTADSCIAVGSADFGAGGDQGATVDHWNGHVWSNRTIERPSRLSMLQGASCPSASVCFAVGSAAGTNDGLDVLVEKGTPS